MLTRFDAARLRPLPLPADGLRHCAATARLLAACRLGAGPATRPALMPWLAPRIEWPFGVLHVADAAVAQRAALLLDGSWAMADAASSAGRWALRGRALWADAAWWRPLQPTDAWDAGEAPSPAALSGFVPRRATLIVIDARTLDAAGAQALGRLEQQAWGWPRAVRVVVAGGAVPAFARPVS
jgi:hypothetical protein